MRQLSRIGQVRDQDLDGYGMRRAQLVGQRLEPIGRAGYENQTVAACGI